VYLKHFVRCELGLADFFLTVVLFCPTQFLNAILGVRMLFLGVRIVIIINNRVVAITTGKPGKVREVDIGQGKVREIRKSPGNCDLSVVYFCRYDSTK